MNFLQENFLLHSKTGKELFFNYAEKQPIIDYHCHLSPREIAEDKRFSSITELMLGGDHYKWRVLRSAGVPEKEITGDADDRVKFKRWAEVLPWCIGNPLYHWTHLELQRYFNITETLSPETEERIWSTCNEKISSKEFSAKGLISQSNVEIICTTDDPCDNLEFHSQIATDKNFKTAVLPAFRPDKIINIDKKEFSAYIKILSEVSGIKINNWAHLQDAIKNRIDFFHSRGCRLSDHALTQVPLETATTTSMDNIISLGVTGKTIESTDVKNFQFQLMLFLAKCYEEKNWVMQLHIGALRNANKKAFETLGADTGFDVVGDYPQAEGLTTLLSKMEYQHGLPKTILYNLNPTDNFILATMIGAFQENGKFNTGKMQFGSGWWYNDQKDGIIRQLTDLGNLGVLGKFIGMLTDSRSFLSYPRHEYFRRIFCNLIGTWVDNGEYPNDESMLKQIVEAVCYQNANNFFSFSK